LQLPDCVLSVAVLFVCSTLSVSVDCFPSLRYNMNDPGLDDAINDHAKTVEQSRAEEEEEEAEYEQSYLAAR